MSIAIISGTKTISVVSTLGRISLQSMRAGSRRPSPIAASTNSLLAQRQHLAADRPRDIGDVDDADDEDRQPQGCPSRCVTGPMSRPLRDQHGRERDREQVDGERPERRRGGARGPVEQPPKKPATSPISGREQQADQRGGDADQQRVAAAVEQPRRDVAALVVGAEEVVPDRQVGPIGVKPSPSPSVSAASPATVLPSTIVVPSRLERERIGVRDVVGVERRQRGRRATISRTAAERRHRGPVAQRAARRRCAHGLAPGDAVAAPRRPRAGARPPVVARTRARAAAPATSLDPDWRASSRTAC